MTVQCGYAPSLRCAANTLIIRDRRLPVPGEVEISAGQSVEASTIVARTSRPGAVHPVPLAALLGCDPREVKEYLRVAVGQALAKGDVLAETPGLFGYFKARIESPVAGVLEAVSEVTGQAMVREPPQAIELPAFFAGRVLEVFPGFGARISTVGALVQGIMGIGGERTGRLAAAVETPSAILEAGGILPEQRGAVLIAGAGVTGDALKRAVEVGVAGIITGAIEARDLRSFLGYDLGVVVTGDESAGLTLILTEGFGCLPMAEATNALLRENQGRMASITGATQIRAGVVRPEIVIPASDAHQDDGARGGSVFRIGARVRIIREPGFGRIGLISGLPEGMQVIETEAQVRVVEVTAEPGGEKITLPRANVELMQ